MQTEQTLMLPSTQKWWQREWAIPTVLIVLGGALWAWFLIDTRYALEDSYITFRFARNIARGAGFVFNPGERVLGTTTPLQTLLLAGLGWILGPERIPTIASTLMPLFGLAAGGLMFAALRKAGLSRLGASIGLAFYLLHPLVLRTGVGGMETPLVLFLMALGLYLVVGGRTIAAAGVAALLFMCRPDGLIWGGCLMAFSLLSPKRKPVLQAIVFILVLLPWLLFAWTYFGTVIPNTVTAKGVIRPGHQQGFFQPARIKSSFLWYLTTIGLTNSLKLCGAGVLLFALGAFALRRKSAILWLLPIYPIVYAVALHAGRAPLQFDWYQVPMMFPALFLAGLGVEQIVLWVKRQPAWLVKPVTVTAAIVGLAAAVFVIADRPRGLRSQREYMDNERVLRRGVGLWLKENTTSTSTVAMEAIGWQGYFSERYIVDQAGLVTPQVVRFKAESGENGVVFKRIWAELKPDYYVLRSFEVDANQHFEGGPLFPTEADRAAFLAHYREVKRLIAPYPNWGNPGHWRLTIYERLKKT